MMSKTTLRRLLPLALVLLVIFAAFPGVALAAEEEATSPLTPLGINGGLLFVQTFNFILIAVILSLVLWRPMVNFLDNRAATIQKGLEDAAAAAKARQNAEAEAEKILAAARAEAAKVIEEARGRGDEVASSIRTSANQEAEKIKTDAVADAKAARNAELAGLRDQVINISVAVAGRILGESIDAKKQENLVSNFFSQIPADAKEISGSVEVISAMPLSDSEQAKVRKELGAEEVTFSVEPAILGGLVVRGTDRVIDGSVRRNLSDLAGRLN